jgi:electron transfer flavoprotein alpha subunit
MNQALTPNALGAVQAVSSMNTLQRPPRIDPRRPAIITPAGLRRIVLGSSEGERLASRLGTHEAAKQARSIGPFTRCVLVVAHAERGTLDEHARQVVAAAAILAAPDTEVVLATLGACGDDAGALGADRLLVQADGARDHSTPMAAAAWLQALCAQLQPVTLYLPDRDADGDLGRRHAVAHGLSLAAGVVEIKSGQLRARAQARMDALCEAAQVVLLAPGAAKTDLPFIGLGQPWATEAPAWPDATNVEANGFKDLGVQAGDARTVALEEADFILSAGNGVTDLALFNQLAEALGAATGASRVAVDDGRFPRAKQIGATGKTVKATTYMAVGISGAVQHLQGIKACRHVIAINTDPAAPIAKRADLVAVDDGAAVMRELLDLIQQHQATKKVAA